MLKRLILFPILLTTHQLFAQGHAGIGYTGAWLNSNSGVAGGFAFYIGRDIVTMPHSTFSLSTNLKIGLEDEIGSGLIIPAFVALAAAGGNTSGVNTGKADGGKTHLFGDAPLLFHYNFGLGSNPNTDEKVGFYIGGGFSYTTTGYTDTAHFSQGTAFFGYVTDGGIRFAKNVDLNFSRVISMRQPIGQMSRPVMYEITLMWYK